MPARRGALTDVRVVMHVPTGEFVMREWDRATGEAGRLKTYFRVTYDWLVDNDVIDPRKFAPSDVWGWTNEYFKDQIVEELLPP